MRPIDIFMEDVVWVIVRFIYTLIGGGIIIGMIAYFIYFEKIPGSIHLIIGLVILLILGLGYYQSLKERASLYGDRR